MPSTVVVISDSEPERREYNEQRAIRKLARKRREQEAVHSSADEDKVVRLARRKIPHSRSTSSTSASDSLNKPVAGPSNVSIHFQSASSLLKAQQLKEKVQQSPAPLLFPLPNTPEFEKDELSGDVSDAESVQQFLIPSATLPKTPTLTQLPLSGEDSPEQSPSKAFARTITAKFLYKAGNASALSAESATVTRNYFKKADAPVAIEASDSDAAKVDIKGKGRVKTTVKLPKAKKANTGLRHLDILPLELISVLEVCPVCDKAWTVSKTAAKKHEHVTDCADSSSRKITDVRKTVESKVRELQAAFVEKQRANVAEKTLFDDVVRGHKSRSSEMNVVGTDAATVAATQGGTVLENATAFEVARELQATRAKVKKASAVPTKSSRLGKALAILDQHSAVTSLYEAEAPLQPVVAPPKPVGQLKNYAVTMHALSEQVDKALDAAVPVKKRKIVSSDSDGSADNSLELEMPPSTQPLQASKLGSRLGVSTNRSGLLGESSGIRNRGLWALASGADEEALKEGLDNDFPLVSRVSTTITPSTLLSSSIPTNSRAPTTNALSHRWLSTKAGTVSAKAKTNVQSDSSAVVPLEIPPGQDIPRVQSKKVSKIVQKEPFEEIEIPEFPDYSDWTLDELQKETGKYGYKPSGTKAACLATLKRIWKALQDHTNAKPKAKRKSPVKSVAKSKSVKSTSDQEDGWSSDGSVTSANSGSSRTARKPRKSNVSLASAGEFLSGSEDGEAADVDGLSEDEAEPISSDFKTSMRRLVMKDSELYGKILMYQPVPFEAFVTISKDNNLKASAITVRQFLDDMCITFYMDQSTGRNRQKKKKSPRKKPPARKTTPVKKKKSTK